MVYYKKHSVRIFNFVLVLLMTSFLGVNIMTAEEGSIQQEYNEEYSRIKELASENSIGDKRQEIWEHQYNIVKLGPAVLPYIIESLEKYNDVYLGDPLLMITWKRFDRSEYENPDAYGSVHATNELHIKWWKEGRRNTSEKFEMRYKKWKDLKKAGKTKEAEDQKLNIRHLGIDALPQMMERIESGDSELIPLVSSVTRDDLPSTSSITQATDWWRQRKSFWQLPPLE
jgi:hypothetical protein